MKTLEERFNEKWLPVTESGCWLWVGTVSGSNSYGYISSGGKNKRAHRISYELFNGEIDDGLSVMHKCDCPSCVNPDHLVLGTHQDNMSDSASKGRKGLKLTPEQVVEIRADDRSGRKLAKQYNVSRRTIDRIKSNQIWKEL